MKTSRIAFYKFVECICDEMSLFSQMSICEARSGLKSMLDYIPKRPGFIISFLNGTHFVHRARLYYISDSHTVDHNDPHYQFLGNMFL